MGEPQHPMPPGSPLEILWRCLACGEVFPRTEWAPLGCPRCHAPPTDLVLVEED